MGQGAEKEPAKGERGPDGGGRLSRLSRLSRGGRKKLSVFPPSLKGVFGGRAGDNRDERDNRSGISLHAALGEPCLSNGRWKAVVTAVTVVTKGGAILRQPCRPRGLNPAIRLRQPPGGYDVGEVTLDAFAKPKLVT